MIERLKSKVLGELLYDLEECRDLVSRYHLLALSSKNDVSAEIYSFYVQAHDKFSEEQEKINEAIHRIKNSKGIINLFWTTYYLGIRRFKIPSTLRDSLTFLFLGRRNSIDFYKSKLETDEKIAYLTHVLGERVAQEFEKLGR